MSRQYFTARARLRWQSNGGLPARLQCEPEWPTIFSLVRRSGSTPLSVRSSLSLRFFVHRSPRLFNFQHYQAHFRTFLTAWPRSARLSFINCYDIISMFLGHTELNKSNFIAHRTFCNRSTETGKRQ